MRDPNHDTIVAIATPPGTGAIAVIRISGSKAISIVNEIFQGKKSLINVPSQTVHYGCIKANPLTLSGLEIPVSGIIDDVLVTVFRAPGSYTGEDLVEISCHGSNFICSRIVAVLLHQGTRVAEAGEYTRRAFLNGKIDLTQAEAVAEIIKASTMVSLQGARNRLDGAIGREVGNLRKKLIESAALVEIGLDFLEEDIDLVDSNHIFVSLEKLRNIIKKMIDTFQKGRILHEGLNVVLTGPPNAGKSSLMNQLVCESRVLVTEIPGTTRDVIREDLDIHGIPVRLFDTAGLRVTGDEVEKLGVAQSIKTIKDADIVLFIAAVDEIFPEKSFAQVCELTDRNKIIIIANKIDLCPISFKADLSISALSGTGIKELCELLSDLGLDDSFYTERTALIASVRHKKNLEVTDDFLCSAQNGLQKDLGYELIAADLRGAISQLEEIIGIVDSDDILNDVFANFCIGK